MKLSVHQAQYLPWLGYFDKIKNSDAFVFLDNVQYKKREFQNRNKIRTKEGWIWLTVPVITKDRFFQKISDVPINNETDWRTDHWKSIEHNYAHAPHFAKYRERFAAVYAKPWEKLQDLNVELVRIFLDILGITTPVYFESAYNITSTSTQRIIDLCKALHADAYLSGAGGKDYMDENLFSQNGLGLEYQHYDHPQYPQVFPGFEPYMCMLDYIFNTDKPL